MSPARFTECGSLSYLNPVPCISILMPFACHFYLFRVKRRNYCINHDLGYVKQEGEPIFALRLNKYLNVTCLSFAFLKQTRYLFSELLKVIRNSDKRRCNNKSNLQQEILKRKLHVRSSDYFSLLCVICHEIKTNVSLMGY